MAEQQTNNKEQQQQLSDDVTKKRKRSPKGGKHWTLEEDKLFVLLHKKFKNQYKEIFSNIPYIYDY